MPSLPPNEIREIIHMLNKYISQQTARLIVSTWPSEGEGTTERIEVIAGNTFRDFIGSYFHNPDYRHITIRDGESTFTITDEEERLKYFLSPDDRIEVGKVYYINVRTP
jgi:hypothetical protein